MDDREARKKKREQAKAAKKEQQGAKGGGGGIYKREHKALEQKEKTARAVNNPNEKFSRTSKAPKSRSSGLRVSKPSAPANSIRSRASSMRTAFASRVRSRY